jgi:hypothetical protein
MIEPKMSTLSSLKRVAKKIPFVPAVYGAMLNVRRACARYRLRSQRQLEVFTQIYNTNGWGAVDSVSGPGSDLHCTRGIVDVLPKLFNEYRVATMLDVPCGDFHWMKTVDLQKVKYIGADIVDALIRENIASYQNDRIEFQSVNLCEDHLPRVDLVFCRDCLVHLSFSHVWSAIANICRSESTYLLTTTFSNRQHNHDIATGEWRPLNLEIPPFNLPRPLVLIHEMAAEDAGQYSDKALGLWRIDDIRKCLRRL